MNYNKLYSFNPLQSELFFKTSLIAVGYEKEVRRKKYLGKVVKCENSQNTTFLSTLSTDPFFRNAGVILIPFNVISNCKVVKLLSKGSKASPY